MLQLAKEGLTGQEILAVAIFDLADAVRFGAKEIGKEGAVGPGAIELLAMSVRDGFEALAAQKEREL